VLAASLLLFACAGGQRASLPEEEARGSGSDRHAARPNGARRRFHRRQRLASGIIGVGLVVPASPPLPGRPELSRCCRTAALLGGGYLLLIDTLARTASSVEIPSASPPPDRTPFFSPVALGASEWS